MNIKLLKAQSLLQEALQEAFSDLADGRLKNIAITKVECSKGREIAKVFLDENSLGETNSAEILKLLKRASGTIRANLQTQLSWYRTPNLTFVIDDSLAEINKLEAIFKQIHAKENSPCSDFLGSASAHSLQRTASVSHSFASHNPKNSSTILEFSNSNDLSLRDLQGDSKQSTKKVQND